MGTKKSFLVYLSSGPMVEALPDAEAGQLFKALFRYGEDQKFPENLSSLAFVAFQAMRPYLDENREKWERTCAARAEAGRAGGIASGKSRAKQVQANKANASKSKQKEANEAEFESEFESEFEYVPRIGEGKVNGACAEAVKDIFKEFAGDNAELLSSLREFEAFRKKIKAPFTDKARKLLLSKLKEFPEKDRIAVLNQSILNGWKSLYPIKADSGRLTAQAAQTAYTKPGDIFE